MAVRKLKPIEERDPYAARVLEAWDRLFPEDGATREEQQVRLNVIRQQKKANDEEGLES